MLNRKTMLRLGITRNNMHSERHVRQANVLLTVMHASEFIDPVAY